MAQFFDVNNAAVSDEYAGTSLFAIKEILVSIGGVVVGSGDGDATPGSSPSDSGRYAFNGVTAALPGGQQGSGGAYDAWQTATSRANVGTYIAGDANNKGAWCVVEFGAGQQILMQVTTGGNTGWGGYCRIAYSPGQGAVPDFVTTGGSAINSYRSPGDTTITPATHELWLIGSRSSSSGSNLYPSTTAGYFHVWGDDDPGAGGALAWGYVFVRSASPQVNGYIIAAAVETGTEDSADPVPAGMAYGSSAPSVNSDGTLSAWSTAGTAMASATSSLNGPWRGAGASRASGNDPITQPSLAFATGRVKGLTKANSYRVSSVNRAWGDRGGTAPNCYVTLGGGGGFVAPWPASATVPLP